MGGNAMKPYGAVRVDKETYDKTLKLVSLLIGSNGFEFSDIPSYRTKESFGDIDILVKVNPFIKEVRKIITTAIEGHFGRELPKESNGPVMSMAIPLSINPEEKQSLQVDFIFSDQSEYDFALKYYSWNDCGNLVGRIANKMGMSFAHYGLIYRVMDKTNVVSTITVTTDFDKALEFLGFDPVRWNQGFDTVEDIYKFIASGKYFTASIFALENRNHTARMRDRKRPTYMGFLEYVKDIQGGYEFSDESEYLQKMFEFFPTTKYHFDEIMKVKKVKDVAKEKFNGDVVSGITGLTGQMLGKFMKSIKGNEPFNDYDYLAKLSKKDIKLEVLKQYDDFKKTNLKSK